MRPELMQTITSECRGRPGSSDNTPLICYSFPPVCLWGVFSCADMRAPRQDVTWSPLRLICDFALYKMSRIELSRESTAWSWGGVSVMRTFNWRRHRKRLNGKKKVRDDAEILRETQEADGELITSSHISCSGSSLQNKILVYKPTFYQIF